MGTRLTIDLPDVVYERLARAAAAEGLSVELAAARAVVAAYFAPGELLLQWRGIITDGPGDLSTRTDEYLGQSYLDTHDDDG